MEVASLQQPSIQSESANMDTSMDIDMDVDLGPLPEEPESIELVSIPNLI